MALRILVLSDLHVEWHPFQPTGVEHDVVILAGDIHSGIDAPRWARRAFPDSKIIFVAGNHELYRNHWTRGIEEIRRHAEINNVHFLENDTCVIDDVRFIGATLWVDFDLFGRPARESVMLASRDYLADFSVILAQEDGAPAKALTPAQMRERHVESRRFIEGELAKPFGGKSVVITHHLPSRRSNAERYQSELSSAGFASNLDDLASRADMWVHGHTHDSFEYTIGNCSVVCNPRGYPVGKTPEGTIFENPEFNPSLIKTI